MLLTLTTATCPRCRKTRDGRSEAEAIAALRATGCVHEPRVRDVVMAASAAGLGLVR
jgi:hypothetical protein